MARKTGWGQSSKKMTERRKLWLQLKANGHSCKEIADIMHISFSGERAFQTNVIWALEAKNTINAIAIGFRQGLIV